MEVMVNRLCHEAVYNVKYQEKNEQIEETQERELKGLF